MIIQQKSSDGYKIQKNINMYRAKRELNMADNLTSFAKASFSKSKEMPKQSNDLISSGSQHLNKLIFIDFPN